MYIFFLQCSIALTEKLYIIRYMRCIQLRMEACKIAQILNNVQSYNFSTLPGMYLTAGSPVTAIRLSIR